MELFVIRIGPCVCVCLSLGLQIEVVISVDSLSSLVVGQNCCLTDCRDCYRSDARGLGLVKGTLGSTRSDNQLSCLNL
jgi:hypothetical protein